MKVLQSKDIKSILMRTAYFPMERFSADLVLANFIVLQKCRYEKAGKETCQSQPATGVHQQGCNKNDGAIMKKSERNLYEYF